MKSTAFLLALLLLTSFFLITPTSADPIIDGTKVYIEDTNVYLSADPHTLGSSGWVTLQLKSKTYTGNIDCAFGYSIGTVRPTRLQIWSNYTHPKQVLITEDVSIYDPINQTWLNSTRGNWSWVNITYEDWRDITASPDIIYYNYSGFNRWYVFKNLPVVQNVMYTARIYLQLPFAGLNNITGEYAFAVKPSLETIPEAISNNHFYILDPWWNSNWGGRAWIEVNPGYITTTLDGFPVAVRPPNFVMNETHGYGNDLRFIANDNITEYPYEIETLNFANTSRSCIWVNITKITSGGFGFWCYYNNSLASAATQNGYAVWDQYYHGVWHMNDSYVAFDSSGFHNQQTGSSPGVNFTGRTGNATYFPAAATAYFNFGDNANLEAGYSPFTLEALWNMTNIDGTARRFVGKYNGAPGFYFNQQQAGAPTRWMYGEIYDGAADDYLPMGDPSPANDLFHYEYMTLFPTRTSAILSVDRGMWWRGTTTGVMATLNNTFDFAIGTWAGGNCYWVGADEIRLTVGTNRNDSWVNATYFMFNFTSKDKFLNWTTFGENFTNPYPEVIILGSPYPANGTNDVCPCNFFFAINSTSTNGSIVNYTWYLRIKKNNIYDLKVFDTANRTLYVQPNSTAWFNISNVCDLPAYSFHHTNATIQAEPVNTWKYVYFPDAVDQEFNSKNINMSNTTNNYTWRVLVSGLYHLQYLLKFVDTGAAPTGTVTCRILVNGVGVHGTLMRAQTSKKDETIPITADALMQLYVGDNISISFQATDNTIYLKSAATGGVAPFSGSIIFQKIMDPLPYNSTFYWYVNVTSYYTPSNLWNQSGIFVFNTTINESTGCGGGGGGSTTYNNYTNFTNYTNITYSNTTGSAGSTGILPEDGTIGLIGIVGLLGLLGFIIWKRRRRT